MDKIIELFNKFPEIETNRFLLREIREDDYKEIFEIYSDEEVLKYQNMVAMKDLEEAENYIKFILNGYKNRRIIRWCIARKNDDKVIGLVALHHIENENLKTSIGYILNKRYWNQKIISEVLSVIIDYIITELKMNRIEANIHPENTGSIKLCEKFGFKREGLLEQSIFNHNKDIFEDRLIYGIIRKNYEGKGLTTIKSK